MITTWPDGGQLRNENEIIVHLQCRVTGILK